MTKNQKTLFRNKKKNEKKGRWGASRKQRNQKK